MYPPRTMLEALAREDAAGNAPLVVGNGPSLRGSGLGEAIDSRGVVVRFNRWFENNQAFQQDYGTKCTIHSCSVSVRSVFPWTLVIVRPADFRKCWLKGEPALPCFPTGQRGQFSSSGLTVISWLLTLVGKVEVAGFDHGSGGHYYDPEHRHSVNHDWEFEKEVFRRLVDEGRMKRLEG